MLCRITLPRKGLTCCGLFADAYTNIQSLGLVLLVTLSFVSCDENTQKKVYSVTTRSIIHAFPDAWLPRDLVARDTNNPSTIDYVLPVQKWQKS